MPTIEKMQAVIPAGFYDDLDLWVEEAFSWQDIITNVTAEKRERSGDITFSLANKALYLVVFESTRDPNADPEQIATLDAAAHAEAESIHPEALLYYHAGAPDENGRARSWCLWTDDKSAREAVNGPAHQEAMSRAPEFYGKNYAIKLFSVISHDEGIIFVPHTHPTTTR